MVAFTSFAVAATSIIGLTAAVPANEIRSTGVVHRITAGSTTANGGLHFGKFLLCKTQQHADLARQSLKTSSPR